MNVILGKPLSVLHFDSTHGVLRTQHHTSTLPEQGIENNLFSPYFLSYKNIYLHKNILICSINIHNILIILLTYLRYSHISHREIHSYAHLISLTIHYQQNHDKLLTLGSHGRYYRDNAWLVCDVKSNVPSDA